eukprot:Rmarinus@m.25939
MLECPFTTNNREQCFGGNSRRCVQRGNERLSDRRTRAHVSVSDVARRARGAFGWSLPGFLTRRSIARAICWSVTRRCQRSPPQRWCCRAYCDILPDFARRGDYGGCRHLARRPKSG